jgi:hypothetical protein
MQLFGLLINYVLDELDLFSNNDSLFDLRLAACFNSGIPALPSDCKRPKAILSRWQQTCVSNFIDIY